MTSPIKPGLVEVDKNPIVHRQLGRPTSPCLHLGLPDLALRVGSGLDIGQGLPGLSWDRSCQAWSGGLDLGLEGWVRPWPGIALAWTGGLGQALALPDRALVGLGFAWPRSGSEAGAARPGLDG